MSKHNIFTMVYMRIRNKHPDWKHGQILACTAYALKYPKRERSNGKV